MTNLEICRAIAALAPLADGARDALQRVFIRIDNEGVTVIAVDGHVAAVVCGDNLEKLPECDGYLESFVAIALRGRFVAEDDQGVEYAGETWRRWVDAWLPMLMPNCVDEMTPEKVFKAMGPFAKPGNPVPLLMPQALGNAMNIARYLGMAQLHFFPSPKPEGPIRIESAADERRLVLAVMPARPEVLE